MAEQENKSNKKARDVTNNEYRSPDYQDKANGYTNQRDSEEAYQSQNDVKHQN